MKYIITENRLHSHVLSYINSEFKGLQRKHVDYGVTFFYDEDGKLLFHLVERDKRSLLRLYINRDFLMKVEGMFKGLISQWEIMDLTEKAIKENVPDIKYDEVTVG